MKQSRIANTTTQLSFEPANTGIQLMEPMNAPTSK